MNAMTNTAKLTDTAQLDWTSARAAAQRIVRICDDAGYTAPEAVDLHCAKVVEVTDRMNDIARNLLIKPPGATPEELEALSRAAWNQGRGDDALVRLLRKLAPGDEALRILDARARDNGYVQAGSDERLPEVKP